MTLSSSFYNAVNRFDATTLANRINADLKS